MANYNKHKENQLGMSLGTAYHQLRKNIIFNLAQQCNKNVCYRCKKQIISCEEFTIDHKTAWLHNENAAAKFFDIENIAFSHRNCNNDEKRCPSIVRNKCGFKGVCFLAKCKKPYRAHMKDEKKKTISLGTFLTAIEAAEAYDKAAVERWGSKAVTNRSLGLMKD